jgi:hypothetical protein
MQIMADVAFNIALCVLHPKIATFFKAAEHSTTTAEIFVRPLRQQLLPPEPLSNPHSVPPS